MASEFYNNSIFWVEVERIQPNPFQPRREFNDEALQSLADSIRQYGVMSPIVVTRKETELGDGGIQVSYELVAGERRLRASKLANIRQIPCLIRSTEDSDKVKLELAIIENLQREDLNPIDRAVAFKQLADQFKLKHVEIAKKVGRSREYVSNTLRLLALPEFMQQAVVAGEITEGHTRPLLMLIDRPEQQQTLFKEISARKLTVRESERIARGIATDRARKRDLPDDLATLERELTEHLGTRVQIETRENGGKVHIDFFSPTDVAQLLALISSTQNVPTTCTTDTDFVSEATPESSEEIILSPLLQFTSTAEVDEDLECAPENQDKENTENPMLTDDSDDEDLYSLRHFVV